MKSGKLASLIAALLALPCAALGSNLLANGSFESPGAGCFAGTTSLPGWTVTTGNIDIMDVTCSDMAAADGTYFIDLTGSHGAGAGTINQTVATTVGAQYNLSFYFGGNPQWQTQAGNPFSIYPNDGPIKSMDVLINGVQQGNTYSVDTTGLAYTNPDWMFESVTFTATSASTTLSFESLNGANGTVYGPLLDGVSLSPVPLPATALLLLSGLGGLGMATRKRVIS